MCYRCGICRGVVPPRQSLRTYIITRVVPPRRVGYQYVDSVGVKRITHHDEPRRTEIECEFPVCGACHYLLIEGMTLEQLRQARAPKPVPSKPIRPSQPHKPEPVNRIVQLGS